MPAKKKKSANALMSSAPAVWAGDNKWRAEEDHRTLTKAGEVMSDRERLKAAKEHAKKQQKHMEKVCK